MLSLPASQHGWDRPLERCRPSSPRPQWPASEIKQTSLSTNLACLLAFERRAAGPHMPFSNIGKSLMPPNFREHISISSKHSFMLRLDSSSGRESHVSAGQPGPGISSLLAQVLIHLWMVSFFKKSLTWCAGGKHNILDLWHPFQKHIHEPSLS